MVLIVYANIDPVLIINEQKLLTKLNTITLSGLEPIQIISLKDTNQYRDHEGRAQRLGITSALWPLFGQIWPSGVLLAKKILNQPIADDAQVLEIGCGLALASLAAHSCQINVTASDYHPEVPNFLRDNLRLNNLPIMPYRYGRWGSDRYAYDIYDTGALPVYERYDLIIGSDLLYEPDSAFFLAQYVDRVSRPRAEVWIVDPNRGYKNSFARALADYGFELIEDRLVELQEGYQLNGAIMPLRGFFLRFKR